VDLEDVDEALKQVGLDPPEDPNACASSSEVESFETFQNSEHFSACESIFRTLFEPLPPQVGKASFSPSFLPSVL
jgi:hypothetical protein